jgi:hypothetical protein
MSYSRQQIGLRTGIFGLIFTPLTIILAYILEPNYNPFLQTISKLGITENGKYFFILGCIVGGISLIIFYLFFFQDLSIIDENIHYARIFGIISGLGLIGVGVIQDKPEFLFKGLHWAASVIFFIFNMLFISFFCQYLINKDKTKEFRFVFKTGFYPVGIALMYTFISFFSQIIILGSLEFKVSVIWQKVTVISLLLWYFIFIFYVQKRKLLEFLNQSNLN